MGEIQLENGVVVKYLLSQNNLKIYDSYRFKTKTEMNLILDEIKEIHPNEELFKVRSRKTLIWEWKTHNLFFENLWYIQSTKDVDFEYPQKKWMTLAYMVCSWFA